MLLFVEADALRNTLSFALAALLIAPAAEPAAPTHQAWKWERAIAPNAASPAAEQCAVLDTDLFAGAAPGLRDLRLVQDGHELAYAIDESVDEHANSENDRSIYDTVATTAFTGTEAPGSVFPKPSPTGDRIATAFLPARVPVERLRLIVADTAHRADLVPHAMQVIVTARPSGCGSLAKGAGGRCVTSCAGTPSAARDAWRKSAGCRRRHGACRSCARIAHACCA